MTGVPDVPDTGERRRRSDSWWHHWAVPTLYFLVILSLTAGSRHELSTYCTNANKATAVTANYIEQGAKTAQKAADAAAKARDAAKLEGDAEAEARFEAQRKRGQQQVNTSKRLLAGFPEQDCPGTIPFVP